MAANTQRLKLVTVVSPVPRYRPHLLARLLTGLDWLSQGRVIFGTGLGVDFDFIPFGEPGEAKTRAGMLDEGLELLVNLLAGEEVNHQGKYYTLQGVKLVPSQVQQPRIPVWIGGDKPAALRRAARWDGWIIGVIDEQMQITIPPEKLAAHVETIQQVRTSRAPFEVAIDGTSNPGERSLLQEYAAAGATWWFESIFGSRGDREAMLARIKAGPPVE